MKSIYRVTIHGRVFESRDLKQLLARAVSEKRNMDRTMKYYAGARDFMSYCLSASSRQALAGRSVEFSV